MARGHHPERAKLTICGMSAAEVVFVHRLNYCARRTSPVTGMRCKDRQKRTPSRSASFGTSRRKRAPLPLIKSKRQKRDHG
jgi:hypothetical protein